MLDEFWKQMEPALPFDDRLLPPNAPILIHEGDLTFAVGSPPRLITLSGRLEQCWLPTPQVRFAGINHQTNRNNLGWPPIEFQSSSNDLAFNGVITGTAELASGLECSGFVQGALRKGPEAAIDELRFSLVNFPSFRGLKVRQQVGDSCLQRLESMVFRADGWDLSIHQRFRVESLLSDVRSHGGYATTHSCSLKRQDGGQFSFVVAQEMLEILTYFFAFLAGRWCGPVLPVGMMQGERHWDIFGSHLLSTRANGYSWFPTIRTLPISELFTSFLSHWQSETWHNPLRQAIHGIVAANSGQDEMNPSIIVAAFVPLEMLCWVVLVEATNVHSATSFNKMKSTKDENRRENITARNIGQMLLEYGITDHIPDYLSALRDDALAALKSSTDSDEGNTQLRASLVLVRIRNAIMHSDRRNQCFLNRLSLSARWQAKELCLKLVELVLLKSMKYNGYYRRRAFIGYDKEVIVPWAEFGNAQE